MRADRTNLFLKSSHSLRLLYAWGRPSPGTLLEDFSYTMWSFRLEVDLVSYDSITHGACVRWVKQPSICSGSTRVFVRNDERLHVDSACATQQQLCAD